MDLYGDPYAMFFLVFWILWTLYFIFNCVIFFRQRKSFYIINRSPWLVFFSAIGQYGMCTSLSWKIIVTPQKFPNMVDHWYLWLFIPLHFIPYPVRSLRFIFLYHVGLPEDAPSSTTKFWQFIRTHHFYSSDAFFLILDWIFNGLAILIGLYRNIAIESNHPGNNGQGNSSTFYISCLVLIVVVSIFLWLGVHYMGNIRDELKIKFEMRCIGIAWIVFILPYVIIGWMDIHPLQIAPIIVICLNVISFMLTFGMPNHLASVKPLEVHNDRFDIMSFLNDSEGRDILDEFAQENLCAPQVNFIKAVDTYRKIGDEAQMQSKFIQIRDKYIADTPYRVNIKILTLKDYLALPGPYDSSTYDKAYVEVMNLLKTDIFPKLLRSKEGKKFANKIKQRNKVSV